MKKALSRQNRFIRHHAVASIGILSAEQKMYPTMHACLRACRQLFFRSSAFKTARAMGTQERNAAEEAESGFRYTPPPHSKHFHFRGRRIVEPENDARV